MLTGCFFTGVESTPKITASDVRRGEPPVTPEDTFLMHVSDEPLSAWQPGKRFTVTDPRIALVMGDTLQTGDVITYTGATEGLSPLATGVTDLHFVSPAGRALTYRINRPLADLTAGAGMSVPYTIQESMVFGADRAMTGRDLYILTQGWRDDRDEPVDSALRFVRVHIDSVTAGNMHYPLKASFTDGRGRSACVFFHPGAKGAAPLTFPVLFSFTDPWLKYPAVTPANRDLISRGRVAAGMTREECRLALGAPKEIERGATQSYLREAWMYDDSHYLLFEDGILVRAR